MAKNATQNINSTTTISSITPASDYFLVSKGGTSLNKITARDALSNTLSGLQNQTTISTTDTIIISPNNGAARKIDYNTLAKAIIEQYDGSSLAGQQITL